MLGRATPFALRPDAASARLTPYPFHATRDLLRAPLVLLGSGLVDPLRVLDAAFSGGDCQLRDRDGEADMASLPSAVSDSRTKG